MEHSNILRKFENILFGLVLAHCNSHFAERRSEEEEARVRDAVRHYIKREIASLDTGGGAGEERKDVANIVKRFLQFCAQEHPKAYEGLAGAGHRKECPGDRSFQEETG
jgi:hypothetical protein